METIKSFLRNLLLFILLPVPFFFIDSSGIPRGSWNTWLLNGEGSAKRQFDGSVIIMFNIWFGIFFTAFVSAIIHFLCQRSPEIQKITDFVMSSLFFIWVALLSPKIALSYETWNWMKAIKFLSRLHDTNHTSKEMVGRAVADFLVQEMVLAKKHDGFKEFNHLENVLRVLDVWKGQRKDIAEKARKLD